MKLHTKEQSLVFFKEWELIFFKMCVYLYLSVYVYTLYTTSWNSAEARQGPWIPFDWAYSQLLLSLQTLETKPGSPARAVDAINY